MGVEAWASRAVDLKARRRRVCKRGSKLCPPGAKGRRRQQPKTGGWVFAVESIKSRYCEGGLAAVTSSCPFWDNGGEKFRTLISGGLTDLRGGQRKKKKALHGKVAAQN